MAAPLRFGYFHSLLASLSLLLHLPVALGQGKQPSDFIWQLQDVDLYRPTGNPSLGRQNFTWCCIKAVQEAVEVQADQLVLRPGYEDWIILDNGDGNITDLVNYTDSSLFPCTAVYSPGDNNGAPIVQVPYIWLADFCPGWQISDKTNLNGWLQPLSGFLLPAVIFCLSVPRRRKLRVPRALFSPELSRMSSYFVVIPNATFAGLMVCFDTIIWLCICFALAGPMILSGLYEALLDNRVLDFVKEKVDNKRLTLDMRCRLLMIILIGNLDLAVDQPDDQPHALNPNAPPQAPPPERCQSDPRGVTSPSIDGASEEQTDKASSCDTHRVVLQTPCKTMSRSSELSPTVNSRGSCAEQRTAILPQGTDDLPASPWWHMEKLLYKIRLYDTDSHMQPFSPAQANNCTDEFGMEIICPHRDSSLLRKRNKYVKRQVLQMKTRLRTMLHCQYSFGSIVGAPVVFFLGGFVFALLQSLNVIGDEDVALGLAFGQWYMTIPHIAIISGLLLAGNNPNILEGVLATEKGESEDDEVSILGIKFQLAYPSCYKVAWQWRRGPTKRKWIKQLLKIYHTTTHENGPNGIDEDMKVLKAKTTLTSLDWFVILGLALVLMGVPYTLAFLTAFFTPVIGISCRALTITIYATVQFAHILLWLWANAGPPAKRKRSTSILNFFCEGGWLDKNGFYNPTSATGFIGHSPNFTWHALVKGVRSPEFRSVSSVWCVIWYFLYSILCTIAVLTALGGTLMQLIGVYSADICQVTVGNWFLPFEQRPIVVISVNTAQMIHTALVFWVPCAVTAIVFMTLVSFIAWWYQRRMRDMFGELVRTIDLPLNDRDDTRTARFN